MYHNPCYAGVAQLVRALPCQGRGRELESLHPHQKDSPNKSGVFFLVCETLILDRERSRVRNASGILQGRKPGLAWQPTELRRGRGIFPREKYL